MTIPWLQENTKQSYIHKDTQIHNTILNTTSKSEDIINQSRSNIDVDPRCFGLDAFVVFIIVL